MAMISRCRFVKCEDGRKRYEPICDHEIEYGTALILLEFLYGMADDPQRMYNNMYRLDGTEYHVFIYDYDMLITEHFHIEIYEWEVPKDELYHTVD